MARKFQEKPMTPQTFHSEFSDLMQRALTQSPVPLAHMIFELEIARAKCTNIFLAIESQKEQMELAHKIIPATNGVIPVKN